MIIKFEDTLMKDKRFTFNYNMKKARYQFNAKKL